MAGLRDATSSCTRSGINNLGHIYTSTIVFRSPTQHHGQDSRRRKEGGSEEDNRKETCASQKGGRYNKKANVIRSWWRTGGWEW